MKKLSICLLAIFATSIFCTSAQQKGDMYVGGSFGIGTNSSIIDGSSSTSLSFEIAPEFGYFVANNFRIGASLSYGISYNGSTIHEFTIMPNLAYYLRICDNFYYTPGLELGFALGASSGITMPGFGMGLNLGSFEFRPTKKLGMSVNLLSFSYALMSHKNEYYSVNSNSVSFNLGLSPSVGVKYYF